MSSFSLSSMPSQGAPGAAQHAGKGRADPDAWERLSAERPDGAEALQALFASLLAGTGNDRPAALPDAVTAAEGFLPAEGLSLPAAGGSLPETLPDLAAALAMIDAGGDPQSGSELLAGGEAESLAAVLAANPALTALAEALGRGPQGQGEPVNQAWTREFAQRAEGLSPLPADMDADALTARLEQIALGTQSFGQTVSPGAAAVAAAILRAAGESGVRADVAPRIDVASSALDGAQPAPAASHQAQSVTGEQRTLPVWNLSTPLHHAQWNEEIGDRVRWMASHQIQAAELKITPPHLGAIEIRISLHKDQMSITFSSPNAAVREALEEAAPRLREMMSASGYESVDVDVSQHSSPQQRESDASSYAAGDGAGEDDAVHGAATLSSDRSLGVIDFYA